MTTRKMDIQVKQLDDMYMAAFVSRGDQIDFRGAWGTLRPTVKEKGLEKPGASFAAVFNAGTVSSGKMEWYAAAMVLDAEQVKSRVKVDGALEELHVSGGKFATWIYEGPYEGLGEAWPALAKELASKGHTTDAKRAAFEIYIDDGKNNGGTPRTQFYVPLA